MKYAIIRIKNQQYKVSEKEEVLIDKQEGKKIEPEVLFVSDDKKAKVGKPKVAGAKVKIKVLDQEVKGEKLYIRKFRAKSRYRRKTGFRPVQTRILVEKITA